MHQRAAWPRRAKGRNCLACVEDDSKGIYTTLGTIESERMERVSKTCTCRGHTYGLFGPRPHQLRRSFDEPIRAGIHHVICDVKLVDRLSIWHTSLHRAVGSHVCGRTIHAHR